MRGSTTALLAASTGLALALAGCGGPGNNTASPQETSAATSTTAGSASTTAANAEPSSSSAPATSTAATKKKHNVVAWVLGLGPGAPEGPPEFTAYRELQRRHCSRVFDRVQELGEPAVTLYTGAARACLAALAGRTDLWASAETALGAVVARQGELTCMDRAALGLLTRLVTLHREHPDRTFVKSAPGEFTAPPCPRIVAASPDHGPAGTSVHLSGRNFAGNIAGVEVFYGPDSSVAADDVHQDSSGLDVTMPAAPGPGQAANVCIVIRADPDWRAAGVVFTYDDAGLGPAAPFACPPPEQSG